MQNNYTVSVLFRDNRTKRWSTPYSYLHTSHIEADRIVIVPVGDFVACAKVVSCKLAEPSPLTSGIEFKHVLRVTDLKVEGKV